MTAVLRGAVRLPDPVVIRLVLCSGNPVYQRIRVEQYGQDHRAGNGSFQKSLRGRMINECEEKGGGVHPEEKKGADKGQDSFDFIRFCVFL